MRTLEGRPVVFLEDIVGMGDIATRVGVTPYAVRKWRERFNDFPAAIANVGSDGTGAAMVWDWTMIEKFLDSHPTLGVVA